MKLDAVAAIAIASAIVIALVPSRALAQPAAAANETRSVPFGNTDIVLHAPSSTLLARHQPSRRPEMTAIFFRPRAGNLNTYLGAFLDCKSLTALRGTAPEKVQILSYAYYLAFTATATNPVPPSRDVICRRFATAPARGMVHWTQPMRPPGARSTPRWKHCRWGSRGSGRLAQDKNGCYQIILNKQPVLGVESREALLTIVTFVKGRQVTYTRAMPYSSAWLSSFVKTVQSEVATFVELNP